MDAQEHQQQNRSEIAQFLEKWDREVEAIQLGLKGFALTARHDFINRRMQAIGDEGMLALETKQATQDCTSSAHAQKPVTLHFSPADQDYTLNTVAITFLNEGGQP